MSEAWIIEVLASVRDSARANAMIRLAEHLDDAILVAASEFHEAVCAPHEVAPHDREDRASAGGPAGRGLH